MKESIRQVTLNEFSEYLITLALGLEHPDSSSWGQFFSRYVANKIDVDEHTFPPIIILKGDPGFGKTGAVFSVAKNLHYIGNCEVILGYNNAPNSSYEDMKGMPLVVGGEFKTILHKALTLPVDAAILKYISYDMENAFLGAALNLSPQHFKDLFLNYITAITADRKELGDEVENQDTYEIKKTVLLTKISDKIVPRLFYHIKVHNNQNTADKVEVELQVKGFKISGSELGTPLPVRKFKFEITQNSATYKEYLENQQIAEVRKVNDEIKEYFHENYDKLKQSKPIFMFLFDEVPNVPAKFQTVYTQLVEKGTTGMGTQLIPERIRQSMIFVFTGNEQNLSTVESSFSAIIVNRGGIFSLKKDIGSFLDYAKTTDIHPAVYKFAEQYAGEFLKFDYSQFEEDEPHPTFRSLENLSNTLKIIEKSVKNQDFLKYLSSKGITPEQFLLKEVSNAAAATIGQGYEPKFMSIYSVYEKLPTPEDILYQGIMPKFDGKDAVLLKFMSKYSMVNYIRSQFVYNLGGPFYNNVEKIFGPLEYDKQNIREQIGTLGQFILSLSPKSKNADDAGRDYQYTLLKDIKTIIFSDVNYIIKGTTLTQTDKENLIKVQTYVKKFLDEKMKLIPEIQELIKEMEEQDRLNSSIISIYEPER
ncbi:MAG: hypothetical protein QXT40_03485 [Candidatus Micrarchaeia archaeon]